RPGRRARATGRQRGQGRPAVAVARPRPGPAPARFASRGARAATAGDRPGAARHRRPGDPAMSRRALAVALAALLPLPLGAQQLVTFTHTQGGANNRPLGYPVPVPVESLDAVDGFRGYASLHARLQALALASDDLSAHEV